MPGRKRTAQRTRHSARKWIEQVLAAAGSEIGLTTSKIHERAEALSGSKIPGYSVYQALRTLVRRKSVVATRQGRELSYRMAGSPMAPPVESPAKTVAEPTPPATVASSTLVLHKMAPGEITVLQVSESHIETATNLHGKLLLERHPRPKK